CGSVVWSQTHPAAMRRHFMLEKSPLVQPSDGKPENTVREQVVAKGSNAVKCFSKSRMLQSKAHRLIPGGSHTYAKGDDQYPVQSPGFIARGKGCHVWDV